MIIKSFTAESAAAALKRVRTDMGADAIVLRSVQIKGRHGRSTFEITACLDRPTVAQSSRLLADQQGGNEKPASVAPASAKRGLSVAPQTAVSCEPSLRLPEKQATTWFKNLVDLDLPPLIIESLAASCDGGPASDVEHSLSDGLLHQLEQIITIKPKFKPGDVVVLVGPPGAGKTSLLGKLAARLVVFDRQRVTLCTLDRSKIGAFDELAWYGETLGAEVIDPRMEFEGITPSADTVTLIDTPSITADEKRLQALAGQIAALKPSHCVAVFSALQRSTDIADAGPSMQKLHPTHVAMTMLDLTHRYGSCWSAAGATGHKLSMITDAPGGESLVQSPDGKAMVHRMLRREVDHEK